MTVWVNWNWGRMAGQPDAPLRLTAPGVLPRGVAVQRQSAANNVNEVTLAHPAAAKAQAQAEASLLIPRKEVEHVYDPLLDVDAGGRACPGRAGR